ncbi:MAG: beta-lactamase family protein [Gemmatimonadetes bacterium]|nr:beta-lactamase family protein [Gemmatimonadota bacterium]
MRLPPRSPLLLAALLLPRAAAAQVPAQVPAFSPPASSQPANAALAGALDAYLRAQADSGFSGVVLVARLDTLILERGYGPAGAVPDTATPFWIGAASRQFAAAAILDLQRAGRLNLLNPISTLIPTAGSEKRGITLEQLMTHTSGLGACDAAAGVERRDSAIQAILSCRMAYLPGEGHLEVTDDYTLLAALVEIASGRPYEGYVGDRLLRPARMTRTGFWGDDGARDVAAPGQTPAPGRLPRSVWRDGWLGPNWGLRGATGMYSTVGDLHRWLLALRDHTVLGDAAPELLASRLVVGHEGDATVYQAFGWEDDIYPGGRREARTGGWEPWAGASSTIWLLPADAIIVLSNAGAVGDESWGSHVARGVRAILLAGATP